MPSTQFIKSLQEPMPLFRRIIVVVFMLLLFFGGTLGLDSILLENDPASIVETYPDAVDVDPVNGTLPAPYPENERRMYMLIVDCLTPATAQNPDIMPYLTNYKYNCTYGRAQNAVDAITTPSLRAMYSGKDTVSIFGSTQNWISNKKIPSVFTQLAQENVSISVYSNLPFRQFGEDISDYNFIDRDPARYPELEKEAIDDSIDNYLSRRNDVVIMHLLTPHDALHHHGLDSQEYLDAYKNADKVIERIDALIGPNETLIVTGDHGHNEDGRHSFGLDCPTFYTIRGPGFKVNHTENIAITDMRYYISWAMGVPLPNDYAAGKYPQALVSRGELPQGFSTADGQNEYFSLEVLKVEKDQLPKLITLVLYAGILTYLWTLMLIDTREQTPWTRAADILSLTAIVPLFFFGASPLVIIPGAALAAAGAALRTRKDKELIKTTIRSAWVAPVSMAFAPLGYILIRYWEYTFYFHRIALYCIWGAIGITGIFLTKRFGAKRTLIWTAFASFFILLPNIYSKGWMGIMGPLLMAFALWYFWEHRMWPWLAERKKTKKKGKKTPSFIRDNSDKIQIAILAGIFIVGFIFYNHKGMNFHFKHWYGPTYWLPPIVFIVLSLAAKAVIFFRPKKTMPAHIIVGALVGLLFIYGTGIYRPHQYLILGAFIIFGALAWALRSRHTTGWAPFNKMGEDDRTYLSNAFIFAFLFLLYYYTVRGNDDYFIWADLIFAALVLGAFYLREYADEKDLAAGYVFLTFIGFLACGWVVLAWTPTNLEWFFLFDWVPYIFVETDVHLFIPFILARYFIPLVLIRVILAQIFKGRAEYTHRPLLAVGGYKVATIMLIFFGIAAYASSSFFFGAVQQDALVMVVLLGLL